MTVGVESLTAQILRMLRDVEQVQYLEEDIHQLIHEAELFAVNQKIDLVTLRGSYFCESGSLQDISAGNLTPKPKKILSVESNFGGKHITRLSRTEVENFGIDYRGLPESGVITGYVIDDREDLVFETIPPALPGTILEIIYTPIPTPYTNVNGETKTNLPDDYYPYIVDFVLSRCFEEDEEGSANFARASKHKNSALQFLGVTTQEELRVSPKNPRNDT